MTLALYILFHDVLYLCKVSSKNHEWFSNYRAETVIYNVQRGITPKLYKIIHSRATNSAISVRIWPKLELIQDFMHVLVICKFKEDQINSNRENVETSIF